MSLKVLTKIAFQGRVYVIAKTVAMKGTPDGGLASLAERI